MTQQTPTASIIICSLNREASLACLLRTLDMQTRKDFEIIIHKEEAPLAELKEQGVREANGEIIIFLDDDVECDPDWFENMMRWFETTNAVGVCGPTFVPSDNLKNRDVFKEGLFKKLYNWFFLEGRAYIPGQITTCGVNTIGGSFPCEETRQMWFVDFLEPSAFGVRKWCIDRAGGIDKFYKGVGEWFDTDLCYRIKGFGPLIFAPDVKVVHRPEKDTTTNKRKETRSRYENYCRWADKFVNKGFKHYLYRLFLKTYYFAKERGWV